jgi:hypothetical protein
MEAPPKSNGERDILGASAIPWLTCLTEVDRLRPSSTQSVRSMSAPSLLLCPQDAKHHTRFTRCLRGQHPSSLPATPSLELPASCNRPWTSATWGQLTVWG